MDLLNLDNNDFTNNNSISRDPNKLTPFLKKDRPVYKAIFRYLPYWADPKLSKYKKYTAVLTNPVTEDKLYVDCPSTPSSDGRPYGPSILWTVDSLIRKRKDDGVDADLTEEVGKWFNRYFNFTSPVYIHKDAQEPSNDGRILMYSYGSKLEKLQALLLNPESIDDPDMQQYVPDEAVNPFSLTDGMDFFLVVKKGTKFGKDYTMSKFTGKITPFQYNDNGVKHVCKKGETPEEQAEENAKILNYLKNNTPDIKPYLYKPWSDSTYTQVAQYLKAILPYREFMKEVLDVSRDDKINQILTSLNVQSDKQPATGAKQTSESVDTTPAKEAIDPEYEALTSENDEINKQPTEQPAAQTGIVDSAPAMNDEFDALMDEV